MLRFLKIIFLLTLLTTLTSCGFHLRGKINFPPQLNPVYIDSPQLYGPFERMLRQTFAESNVVVTSSPQEANAILKITTENVGQTNTATSASNNIQVYTITFAISYEILNRQGKVMVGTQTVAPSTSFTANSNQMLGTSNQENNVITTLRREAIFLMTSQLTSTQTRNALNKNYAATATTTTK